MQRIEQLYNQGINHFTNKQYVEARNCFANALKLLPNDPQLAKAMAITMANLADYKGAKTYYEMAIRFTKGEPELDLLDGFGFLLHHMGEHEKSAEIYTKIVRRQPNFVKGWFILSDIYSAKFEFANALKCFEQVSRIDPLNEGVLQGMSNAYHSICMWEEAGKADKKIVEVSERLMKEDRDIPLEQHLAVLFIKSGAFMKKIACSQGNTVKRFFENSGSKIKRKKRTKQYDRIRVGYLSSALSRHATAHLIQDFFKNHDKARFEVFVFAGKLNLPCRMFDKIKSSVEHFYDVSERSDPDIAQFIHDRDLDILIDLDGNIRFNKRGALYFKPAPVQITWLGTPATQGSPWIDYILSDNIISPKEYENHYTEKILRMPDCYAFNSFASLDFEFTARAEWGLPDDKFIFASFNSSKKVDHESFEAWCEILARVENSVIWMLVDNEETRLNLIKELNKKNIDPARLIPASRIDLDKHMTRLNNADLMLDCFICGAHTTAAEALYCELPIVTKIGEPFHSRVASSILKAAELEDLVTHTTNEFIDKAVEIANNPDRLAKLKKHLRDNKNSLPLFDQKKWMKNFEDILRSVVK